MLGVDAAVGYDGEQLFDPVFKAGVRAAGARFKLKSPSDSQTGGAAGLAAAVLMETAVASMGAVGLAAAVSMGLAAASLLFLISMAAQQRDHNEG